eukprot:Hpha_TRINITY_DN32116_c0_g1::TRINITY_DN32116_c0_g1_i1::g.18431::m.18431
MLSFRGYLRGRSGVRVVAAQARWVQKPPGRNDEMRERESGYRRPSDWKQVGARLFTEEQRKIFKPVETGPKWGTVTGEGLQSALGKVGFRSKSVSKEAASPEEKATEERRISAGAAVGFVTIAASAVLQSFNLTQFVPFTVVAGFFATKYIQDNFAYKPGAYSIQATMTVSLAAGGIALLIPDHVVLAYTTVWLAWLCYSVVQVVT